MQYRDFGRTGIKISTLGFGAMRLPQTSLNGKKVFDTEEGVRIIHRVIEQLYTGNSPFFDHGRHRSF